MEPVACAKGTVTCITMTHFTTFACKRIIRPCPGLNILCGPNGSGKSSVVSAICLGLGFAEKVIDDKKKVRDYISKGCSFCEIEIQLSDGGMRRSTFTRKFFLRPGTKDVFTINGERMASQTAYNNFVRREYHIRLENVTQYLPQSKLEEFKRLKPKERLTRTLEAVRPELLQQRAAMERRDEDKAKKEAALKTSKDLVDTAGKALEKHRREAVRIREQLESTDELRLLELGILAKEREEATKKVKEQKLRNKQIKEHFRTAKARADAAQAAEEEAKKAVTGDRKAAGASYKKMVAAARAQQKAAMTTHQALRAIEVAQQEVGELQVEVDKAKELRNDMQQICDGHARSLEDLKQRHGSKEALAAKVKELKEKNAAAHAAVEALQDEEEEVRDKLNESREETQHLIGQLQKLEKKDSRQGKYVRFPADGGHISENERLIKFRRDLARVADGDVYGPVAVEIWATDKKYATVISNAVNCKQAFVATNQKDYDVLSAELLKRQLHRQYGVRMSKVTDASVGAGNHERSPFALSPRLKELGVVGWVPEILRATNKYVLEQVRSSSNISNQMFGEAECAKNVPAIEQELRRLMTRPGAVTLHILPAQALTSPKVWKLTRSRYANAFYSNFNRSVRRDAQVFYPPDHEHDEQLASKKKKVEANRQQEAQLVKTLKGLRERTTAARKIAKETEMRDVKPLLQAKLSWGSLERKMHGQKAKIAKQENLVRELEETMEDRRKEAEGEIEQAQAKFKQRFSAHVALCGAEFVDESVTTAVLGLKAAHGTRRLAALTDAADAANDEVAEHEVSYRGAKGELAKFEEEQNDEKFDVFKNKCALMACDLAPKPAPGHDRYARKSHLIDCHCPKPAGKKAKERHRCQNKAYTFLLQDIRGKPLRFRVDGAIKTQTISEATLAECRRLERTKRERAGQAQDRDALRKRLEELELQIRAEEAQFSRALAAAEGAKQSLDREFKDHMDTKKRWLMELANIVDKLNDKFSRLMNQIGNVGKWELDNLAQPVHETKLMELSMKLTASFAAAEDGLQGDLLHMQRLSGGENAVTTCVALMAVQQQYPAPFRIADEVNQGMDEINRWLTLNLLTERPRLASPDDGKQFFILTPKLLRQIDYKRDDVKAILLMNGPDVAWDGTTSPSLAKVLAHRRRLLGGGRGDGGGGGAARPQKRKVSSGGGRNMRGRVEQDDEEDDDAEDVF